MSSLNQGEGRISLPPPNIGMRGASRESGSGSGSMSVINSIANGISKKSFFKGFLGRGGSQKNDDRVGSRDSSAGQNLMGSASNNVRGDSN